MNRIQRATAVLRKYGLGRKKPLWKGSMACLSLCLCLCSLLSSCQKKEEAKGKKKIQIGITVYDSYDTFLLGYMAAFEKEISKKREEGVEIGLFRYNAASSQALQNEQVEEMLEKGCDVLCVNLVDRTAPSEIIDMAKQKNVPIVFFNRELVEEDLAQWNRLYYVGADAKQSGILQGEMAAEDILADEVEKPTPEVPLASPEDGREEESRIRESEHKAESEGAVLGESRETSSEYYTAKPFQRRDAEAEGIQDFARQKGREDLERLEREAGFLEDGWVNLGEATSDAETMGAEGEEEESRKDIILSSRVDKNGDGIIQYLMFEGEAGHQDAIVRTEYSVNTLMQQGIPMEKLSYAIANWSRAEAQSKMMQFYPEFQDQIELILSNNDDMALGVLDAYDKIGLPKDKRPFIYGIDGTVVGLEAVKKGNLMGTVYNDEQGQAKALFQLAYRLGTGKKGPEDEGENKKIIRLPYQKVRREDSQRLLEEKEKK